jgi:tRNA(Ile)-lysidine synthase
MSDLVEQVRHTILHKRLLRPGQPVVLAVSGGLDSMVLLHLLARLSGEHQWRLVVAHLNHGLRGRESHGDQAFVRAAAARLGLPFVAKRAAVNRHAQQHKLSVEMAARQLRHQFLARAALACGAATVALAHHADDQVETFFLRLLRGAGGESLGGMRYRSPSPADPRVELIRPLLGCRRNALRDFAQAAKVDFREDASNVQSDFLRNRIRHELLPLLTAEFQPALATTVLRTMELVGTESEYVGELARGWLARARRPPFARLHVALQRRVLRSQLLALGLAPAFDLIEALRLAPDKPVMAEPGLQLRRAADGAVSLGRVKTVSFDPRRLTVELAGPSGTAPFGPLAVEWALKPLAPGAWQALEPQPGAERFDADKVGSPIHLRHWQPGDRFQPIGLRQACKLQDLFVNLKVPRPERHRRVLATTRQGVVFWVEGLRISEQFRLDNGTRRCLEWRWRRLAEA